MNRLHIARYLLSLSDYAARTELRLPSLLLSACLLCACAAPTAKVLASRDLPGNLLILVSDDQSRCDLAAYGNPACRTPHLDQLAAEGMRFERGYTPVPICMPSRACYYTSLYPHQNGAMGFVPIREDVATWPELLAGHCATGMIGKFNVLPRAKFPFEYYHGTGSLPGEARQPIKYEQLFRDFLAQAGDRRFALIVNLRDPHRPFDPQHYTAAEHGRADSDPPPVTAPADVWVPPFLWDTPATRTELAKYYGAELRLDDTVGLILSALEDAGHRDDTLVIFTSDNGMPFPFAKTTLYEPGINLPFIVRWPGVVEPGSSSEAMVSLMDLLPTALESFGVEPTDRSKAGLEGRSLLPLLRGETDSIRDSVFAAQDGQLGSPDCPSRAIRERRYKYIRNFRPGTEFTNMVLEFSNTWRSWEREAEDHPELAARMDALRIRAPEELFDLERDPWELNDLARDPGHAEVLHRLQRRLRAWMARTGDPLLDEWPEQAGTDS